MMALGGALFEAIQLGDDKILNPHFSRLSRSPLQRSARAGNGAARSEGSTLRRSRRNTHRCRRTGHRQRHLPGHRRPAPLTADGSQRTQDLMDESQVSRRAALKQMARTASVCAAGAAAYLSNHSAARAATSEMSVQVLLDEPIGFINPGLYGQFAEHIGGVIYDGIWVGPDSKFANIGGIRRRSSSTSAAWGTSSSAGPAAASPTVTTGATESDRGTSAHGDLAAGKRTPSPTSSAPTSSCSFCRLVRCRALSRRQRRHGHCRRIPALGRILQCAGRQNDPRRRARGQRRPRAVGRSLLGRRKRKLGLRRKIHARGLLHAISQIHRMAARITVCILILIASGPNGNDLNWTRRFFKKWKDYARAPLNGLGGPLLLRHDRARTQVHP